MPSQSYRAWLTTRAAALDELEAAHSSVGGTGRGRRYATQQINHAYTVLVASQFQAFCRDLHTESVSFFIASLNLPFWGVPLVQARFIDGRQLNSKNAQPSSIGSDFGILGIEFWKEVRAHHPQNQARRDSLEELNSWRNAIAHQDFSKLSGGSPRLTLHQVRRWRSLCSRLARSFDDVMRNHLHMLAGSFPWPP